MRRTRVLCLALLAFALTGCGGGTLGRHGFKKDVESIQSLAAESALVARQVGHGDVTATFVRVHTQYLEKVAGSLGSSLAGATFPPELRVDRRTAVRLASLLDRDLRLLHESPGDQAVGARVAPELERVANKAQELAK